ncbi:scramblase (macronuclear) [Tetrahymena thermophila SB210]|uniref:Phospholipid scramblase n=1 Tax=Tetrahymena thermophila (strain SB210) TaxID=312017 RepID=Q235W9_TETTS|nr:scramblase [Tetrahymena thermophila SB210]EAR92631.2 scramblase [Tetrahymena thermophila SB210]|eukprot:XP_001012876.2 scramblase [Tetrahymena thermophila SB210]
MSDQTELANAKHVLIKQRIEWLEIIPCYEEENSYEIHTCASDFTSPSQNPIATVIEKRGSLCCLFCCKAFREYENEYQHSGLTVATSHRPYKIPICQYAFIPLCKPEIDVQRGGQHIGKAEWPCWHPCWPARGLLSCQEFDIKDAQGNIIYNITANCLQLGFICPVLGILEPCKTREYEIRNADKVVVGKIVNIYNGILEECCTRADQFGIQFPDDCTVEQKLLIIETAVFLDYLQYWA